MATTSTYSGMLIERPAKKKKASASKKKKGPKSFEELRKHVNEKLGYGS